LVKKKKKKINTGTSLDMSQPILSLFFLSPLIISLCLLKKKKKKKEKKITKSKFEVLHKT